MRATFVLPCLVLALSAPLHAVPSPRPRSTADPLAGEPPVAAAAARGQDAPKPVPLKPAGSKPTAQAPAGKPATPPPAPAQAEAPTEKSLLVAFERSFLPSNSDARADAITQLGESSRELPDGGSSKLVASKLAKGLLDEDLDVREAAITQLSWGRHVDCVIEDLGEGLEDLLKEVDQRLTRPDKESREYVTRGSQIFGDGAKALANYPDDRSVEVLVKLLRGLPRNVNSSTNLSPWVVGPLTEAVLRFGTHDAVEAAVLQSQTYVRVGQGGPAKRLHNALAAFALKRETTPPEYSANVSVEWNRWFEKICDKLPKHLPKLKTPPTSPPPK